MKLLITGICGFVGSSIARHLLKHSDSIKIFGIDNFIRPGAQENLPELKALGAKIIHGDIRNQSDFESIPAVDWVIDAAANPSVLAGVDGQTSSRQLIEHNLQGTINILEYCKAKISGLVLLSTSRVYSIKPLSELSIEARDDAFHPILVDQNDKGISGNGLTEVFPTYAPISLYGSSKICSENLAFEYGATFDIPVIVNRCGVLAGPGQFGRPDQGIFSYWLNSYLRKAPLRYIGFGGGGYQVRDCLHPVDLCQLIQKQIAQSNSRSELIPYNVSGGISSSISLKQLSQWCANRWPNHEVYSDLNPRSFDIPWLVLDSSKAMQKWGWEPTHSLEETLSEIAEHAEANPNWLQISSPL